MARTETTTYRCDKCGKKLKTCNNEMDIVTSVGADDFSTPFWSRLHVSITYKHGCHNDGHESKAELCQSCAVSLLADALKRVRKGERTSAGSVHPEQETWE